MLSLHCALLASATCFLYAAGREFHGPGLGGMSYHSYPSRKAYVPSEDQAPLRALPLRQAPHGKQFRPLLHDFHTPVEKGFEEAPRFPIRHFGISGGFPAQLNGPVREVPLDGGFAAVGNSIGGFGLHDAFGGLHEPIRNLVPHAAFGRGRDPVRSLGVLSGLHVPIKPFGSHRDFGGVPVAPQPAVRDLPRPSLRALLHKDIGVRNLEAETLLGDALQRAAFDVYPNQIAKHTGYAGPRHLIGPLRPRVGGFAHQSFGPGVGNTRFGRFGGYKIPEPFLTSVARFSGGYAHHKVPLALVEGGFVGHHFGTPVVDGIVKAGVPVSLAREW